MNGNLYVFWPYDLFPYCLGGIATEFKGDKAYVPPYQGYFRPFLVTDVEHGAKLHSKLKELEEKRHCELDSVNEKYRKELKELIQIPTRYN